jgi:hypothetical protein
VGDTGIQVIQGLVGDTGIQGLKGDTGSQGIQGLVGDTGIQGIQGKDGLNSTLGGYILNRGVGAFPIYGSIDNFESLGMNRYIKGEKESFVVLPRYRLILYSADNKFIQLTNSSFVDIQYFNIDTITQTTSCKLLKQDENNNFIPVTTTSNINDTQFWLTILPLLIAGGRSLNGIALSNDNGKSWFLPKNQPFTQLAYGRCAYDGSKIVIGGNQNIAYSTDRGDTWTAVGFTSLNLVYKIIYIPQTKMWFAVGSNGTIGRNDNVSTIARSTDGINWLIIAQSVFDYGECHDIIYNGSVYIALGFGSQYSMQTSADGITWNPNTSFILNNTGNSNTQRGNSIFNDGSRYILGCDFAYNDINSPLSNIFVSNDGITWDRSVNRYVPFHIKSIAYNGVDTYVIVGFERGNVGGTIFYYYSHDLITFTKANGDNLLFSQNYWVVWDGTNFIISGAGSASQSPSIIYSSNGKDWLLSQNVPFDRPSLGITSIGI